MNPAVAEAFTPEVGVVRSRARDTEGIVTLSVALPGRGVLQYEPGQFNMLLVHGIGEIPVSISGLSQDRGAYLHTIRAVGAVSQALCQLKRGSSLGVRGPYGTHWPLEALGGGDLLLVAGGLGLAPLRPAIRWALRNRARFKELFILYGARTPADLLYEKEWARWTQGRGATLRVTVDRPGRGWRGLVGTPSDALPRRLHEPGKAAALLCGPEIMMRYVSQDLGALGVPKARIFVSLERNMKCALGLCGRCQLERHFVCRDGPVFALPRVERLLSTREL